MPSDARVSKEVSIGSRQIAVCQMSCCPPLGLREAERDRSRPFWVPLDTSGMLQRRSQPQALPNHNLILGTNTGAGLVCVMMFQAMPLDHLAASGFLRLGAYSCLCVWVFGCLEFVSFWLPFTAPSLHTRGPAVGFTCEAGVASVFVSCSNT